MDSNQSKDEPDIYSGEFLRMLYQHPRDHIDRVLNPAKENHARHEGNRGNNDKFNASEKRKLLDYFMKVVEMKSASAKLWTDLQHHLCFVYRYCMTNDPDPEQEILSHLFVSDMRNIVLRLLEEDRIQLCLRLFSLIREYTIFAHKQHKKIANIESSIESLFYYYEAFLSATKNICKIFPEIEKLLINTYKLGWLDFNTSIFMYYFYETPYVQRVVREFEKMKNNVSIKGAGIYTVLTELHKLWRTQMLGINSAIAHKLGAKFKGLDSKMLSAHKRILNKNFWIDRSVKEKSAQDMRLFDCQLFTLVGNKNLEIPEPTLDEWGQCMCEYCLLIKYKSALDNKQLKIKDFMTVSCRFCNQLIELDKFQQHVNECRSDVAGNNCKNLSKNVELLKNCIRNGGSHNHDYIPSIKRPVNGDLLQDRSPKSGSEAPVSSIEDDEEEAERYSLTNFNVTDVSRKSLYAFIKHSRRMSRDIDNYKDVSKSFDTPPKSQNLPKHGTAKTEEPKPVDASKATKGTNTVNKNAGMTFPCGHSCKLEEELKSEFKKAYQDTCDHHRESKKCDCTFCEVFGTTTSHVHKTNETRNRLRIRLNQRNENGNCKVRAKVNINNTKTQSVKNEVVNQEEGNLMNDIHGILNYIEGNTNIDKFAIAEKKAAKKARQRHKKEQEKLKIEEEEKKRRAEEKRLNDERIRNEELARQLAEKAAKSSKNGNKKKKQKNKEQSSELLEETIPAMVTIKRVAQNDAALPTVTITLKGSTPDQDKLLYTLVNGHDGDQPCDKKNKKKESNATVNLEVNAGSNNKKKKNKSQIKPTVVTKEVRVTLAVDPVSTSESKKKTKDKKKKEDVKKGAQNKEVDLSIPTLKLPPGITITKVDGPMTDRNYKAVEASAFKSNMPVSKSGVIVVDTEKLIKQSETTNGVSKKNRKKKNKKQKEAVEVVAAPVPKPSMVTLKNPIFHNMQNVRPEQELAPDLGGQQAAIFKNENGMVTIRSSRLQQRLNNIIGSTQFMPDLTTCVSPEVPTTYTSSCNFSELSKISPFNAQEILSGLPGIEITKVDKNSTKNDLDLKKSYHTAEVSIIPTNQIEKFNFDKDDLHYDNVFTPKDILEDDMDADERELEAFKRFCQQSVPPKRKEKVAHLNVKDIVLKKKNDKVSA